jgi:hypothetical protein
MEKAIMILQHPGIFGWKEAESLAGEAPGQSR